LECKINPKILNHKILLLFSHTISQLLSLNGLKEIPLQ